MSDTPITRQAFNEAEKLSTFAHQRRFLFDKMEIMERENAKLREAEHPYREALEKIAASNDGWGCIEIAKRALGR